MADQMTMSREEQEKKLRAFYDADSSLQSIHLYPEYVEVEISYEELKTRWLVRFHHHIALTQIGVWDETILDHAEVLESSGLITDATEHIRTNNGDTPSPGMGVRQYDGPWYHYRIVLIDGSSLDVVASDVTVEKR